MTTSLRLRLAELVTVATDGEVSAADALAETESLALQGVSSLAYLRLIEAVERRYAIVFDLDGDVSYLDTIDRLAEHLRARGIEEEP